MSKQFIIQLLLIIMFKANAVSAQYFNCNDYNLKLKNESVISYKTCGSGDIIVFIHAGGLDKEMWHEQLKYFKENFRIIAYDIRGHGLSSFSKNEKFEIEDLEIILEHENVEHINLVGCSLGATIALDFAINHPELVENLMLVSPGLIGLQEKNPAYLAQMHSYVNALQKQDTLAIIKKLKELNAIGADQRVLPNKVDEYVESRLKSYVKGKGLTKVPLLKTTDPINSLNYINIPTLIVYGDQDHDYIIENANYIKEHVSNASIVKVDNTGHLPNLERPKEFNRILSEFISVK